MAATHWTLFRYPPALDLYGHTSDRPAADWVLLVDLIVTIPALYWLIFRSPPKALLKPCAALALGGILFGMAAIPDDQKHLWRLFEDYWVLAGMGQVALELGLLVVVVREVRALALAGGNVDESLAAVLAARFGRLAPPLLFEARIWYYALILRDGARLRFKGDRHFTYYRNQGNASTQVAFIFVLLFDLPLSHMLLHFTVQSAWVAWTVDALQLWTLLYLVAEYRATYWRPISLHRNTLLLRCGVFSPDRILSLSSILLVQRCGNDVRRRRSIVRLRQCGALNVMMELAPGTRLPDIFGRLRAVTHVYLSLDEPDAFIDAIQQRQARLPG
jgi:hypothetical protein